MNITIPREVAERCYNEHPSHSLLKHIISLLLESKYEELEKITDILNEIPKIKGYSNGIIYTVGESNSEDSQYLDVFAYIADGIYCLISKDIEFRNKYGEVVKAGHKILKEDTLVPTQEESNTYYKTGLIMLVCDNFSQDEDEFYYSYSVVIKV